MPVALITGSQTCIPGELVRKYGITILPYLLELDGVTYRDGLDITPEEFYRLLPLLKQPPRTSSISPGIFAEAFSKLAASVDGILVVTISSNISGVYNNARLAAEGFTGVPIKVLDSGTAAIAQGLVVLEGAKLAQTGASLEECYHGSREAASKVELLAYLDTFEYLERSGRVNVPPAYSGDSTSLKPVFRLKQGEISLLCHQPSGGEASLYMAEKIQSVQERRGPLTVSVFHASAPAEADELARLIRRGVKLKEGIIYSRFTPVMGCHTGPRVFGAAFI